MGYLLDAQSYQQTSLVFLPRRAGLTRGLKRVSNNLGKQTKNGPTLVGPCTWLLNRSFIDQKPEVTRCNFAQQAARQIAPGLGDCASSRAAPQESAADGISSPTTGL